MSTNPETQSQEVSASVNSLKWSIGLSLLLTGLAACGGDAGPSDATQSDIPLEPLAPVTCVFPEALPPAGCDSCHGAPPQTDTHPDNPYCSRCHGHVVDEAYAFVQPDRHADGTVDYAVGCSSCHGWDLGVSPPQDLHQDCTHGGPGVGAHQAMRRAAVAAHQVGCANCHLVPLTTWYPGHIDGDGRAEVVFRHLAPAHGAQPEWDGDTCTNVYCHGATLTGGDHKNPSWSDTSRRAGRCGACHRLTDPQGNPDVDCSTCHPTSVDAEGKLLPLGAHLNGTVDLPKEAE